MRAGVGCNADADAEPLGARFAQRQPQRRVLGVSRVEVQRCQYCGEVRSLLERLLKFDQLRAVETLAWLERVVALDELRVVALQAGDLQFSDGIRRAAVNLDTQRCCGVICIDLGGRIGQLGAGEIARLNRGQQLRLRGLPLR